MANGLYLITKDSLSSAIKDKFQHPTIVASVSSSDCTSHILLHWQLRHPSLTIFKYLKLLELSHYIPFNVCDVFHLSKQRRDSFPSCNTEMFAKFELLHVDIWGLYKYMSLTSASYFLTVVDYHSCFTKHTLWSLKVMLPSYQIIISSFYKLNLMAGLSWCALITT